MANGHYVIPKLVEDTSLKRARTEINGEDALKVANVGQSQVDLTPVTDALGSPSDSPYSGSGNGTVISLLKGIKNSIAPAALRLDNLGDSNYGKDIVAFSPLSLSSIGISAIPGDTQRLIFEFQLDGIETLEIPVLWRLRTYNTVQRLNIVWSWKNMDYQLFHWCIDFDTSALTLTYNTTYSYLVNLTQDTASSTSPSSELYLTRVYALNY